MSRVRRESRSVRVARALLAPLAAWLLRALAATWRVERRGRDPIAAGEHLGGGLGSLWHCNVLIAAGVFRDSGIHVPVSRSRDGEHITAVMAHLGVGAPPRGSSSRAGVSALRGMVELVREGRLVAVMSDGPRGPARVAKPGVVAVSRMTGRPIHPVAFSARPSLRFRSWDGTLLPLPFARVLYAFGEPLECQPDADDALLARALGMRLDALTEALDRELGLEGAGPATGAENPPGSPPPRRPPAP